MKITSIALPLLISPLAAHAASVSLDFSTAAQYNSNFVETLAAGNIGHSSGSQNVLYNPAGDNGTSIIRYDTNTGNMAYDDAAFLTETISATFSFAELAASQSVGFITRIQTSGPSSGLGILGLFNKDSSSSIQLRLFSGSSTNSGNVPGTAFYAASFNLSTGLVTTTTGTGGTGSTNTFAVNSPLAFVFTQTSGLDPVFSLTVSDDQGLIASTGSQAFTTNDNYNNPGAVAVRFNSGTAAKTTTMDDFSIVPEPSTALLGAIGALALLRRRR